MGNAALKLDPQEELGEESLEGSENIIFLSSKDLPQLPEETRDLVRMGVYSCFEIDNKDTYIVVKSGGQCIFINSQGELIESRDLSKNELNRLNLGKSVEFRN